MSNFLSPKKSSFDNILRFAFITWFFINIIFSYFLIPLQFHSVATDILQAIFVISLLIVFPYFTISRRISISRLNKIARSGIDELVQKGITIPDSVYLNSEKSKINLERYSDFYNAYEFHQLTVQFSSTTNLKEIVVNPSPDDVPMYNDDDSIPVLNPDETPKEIKSPKESFDELTNPSKEGAADSATNNN